MRHLPVPICDPKALIALITGHAGHGWALPVWQAVKGTTKALDP